MTDWEVVNDNLRRFVDNKHTKRNVVRLNSGNTLRHEMRKAKLCYFLQKMGRVFLCEAPLICGGRADVLVLDVSPPIAYEVVMSEKKSSVDRKRRRWSPISVKVITVE